MTDRVRGGYVTIKETYVTYLNSEEMEAYHDGASIVDYYESGDLVEVEVTDIEYGS
jgi:hypothetical protein